MAGNIHAMVILAKDPKFAKPRTGTRNARRLLPEDFDPRSWIDENMRLAHLPETEDAGTRASYSALVAALKDKVARIDYLTRQIEGIGEDRQALDEKYDAAERANRDTTDISESFDDLNERENKYALERLDALDALSFVDIALKTPELIEKALRKEKAAPSQASAAAIPYDRLVELLEGRITELAKLLPALAELRSSVMRGGGGDDMLTLQAIKRRQIELESQLEIVGGILRSPAGQPKTNFVSAALLKAREAFFPKK